MKVKIYRNLHKDCFSVLNYKTKRLAKHSNLITLENAMFVVSQKGRARVLRTKQKSVHAFIIGEEIESNTNITIETLQNAGYVRVFYDPYKHNIFVNRFNISVLKAKSVICINNKVYAQDLTLAPKAEENLPLI